MSQTNKKPVFNSDIFIDLVKNQLRKRITKYKYNKRQHLE